MTDPQYPQINRTRSRVQFVLLGMLFFAPFILAYSAYWLFPNWTPQGRVNYGQLLTPTQSAPAIAFTNADGTPLAADPLRGKWTMVQLVTADCDEACRRELVLTRQVHAALGVKRERVQHILIAADGAAIAALKARYGSDQPDLVWLADAQGSANARAFFANTPAHSVMLVDPLGTWLMVYPHAGDDEAVKRDFRGMQKDINKLLKLSSIG